MLTLPKKILSLLVTTLCFLLFFVSAGWSDTPAPPVNQTIGFDDGIFNNLVEADCRLCHDDPDVIGPTPNVDRHHLLYGAPLPQGECSVNRNACLSDANCVSGICSTTGAPCAIDAECLNFTFGETCGEVCIGETVVPNLDANQDGSDDTTYGCLNCHTQDSTGGIITFVVTRDCLQCHLQVDKEASVHHLTKTAQGTDSPLGFPDVGDCTPCHGTLVDDIGDSHTIPTYLPTLVTPSPSGGDGLPFNSRGNGAGACDYCHDSGTDITTGVEVFNDADTHHNTGVFQSETGVINNDTCLWCHNPVLPEYDIRTCEGCHGYESLHNIQVDSDGDDVINPGVELPFFGHIGDPDDCWGCHGFSMAAEAPESGSITPHISSSDRLVITAGTDTTITLTGSGFTNPPGVLPLASSVALIADDGSSLILTPDGISENMLTVTIPATAAVGNYSLKAIKGDTAASNPVVISIKPDVVITDVSCDGTTLVITGTGFGVAPPDGTEEYINVTMDNVLVEATSWSNTEVTASISYCGDGITINTLYGSAAYGTALACDCEGNFDSDSDVDGSDAAKIKADFGRLIIFNPCTNEAPCNGDFDCDQDVDGSDSITFKEDFGRNAFHNPCSVCPVDVRCSY